MMLDWVEEATELDAQLAIAQEASILGANRDINRQVCQINLHIQDRNENAWLKCSFVFAFYIVASRILFRAARWWTRCRLTPMSVTIRHR